VALVKDPEQEYKNLCKSHLNQKEELLSCINEAEKIVQQEGKEQKEAEDMFDAKLVHIAAAGAAKPKICSIHMKLIPGVANQGCTIIFGGGRIVLHILEVQESQSTTK